MKMLPCSAPGCSNRSDKDPDKHLSFHNLPFRNKKLAKMWLDQLASLGYAFYDKKNLRMSTFVINTSQRIIAKSVTDMKSWA